MFASELGAVGSPNGHQCGHAGHKREGIARGGWNGRHYRMLRLDRTLSLAYDSFCIAITSNAFLLRLAVLLLEPFGPGPRSSRVGSR